MADGFADCVEIVGALELGANRFEGERHVGAGVAIGDGVDVERVDHFLVTKKQVTERCNDSSDFLRAKSLGHRHGGNGRRSAPNLSG